MPKKREQTINIPWKSNETGKTDFIIFSSWFWSVSLWCISMNDVNEANIRPYARKKATWIRILTSSKLYTISKATGYFQGWLLNKQKFVNKHTQRLAHHANARSLTFPSQNGRHYVFGKIPHETGDLSWVWESCLFAKCGSRVLLWAKMATILNRLNF